MARIRSVQPGMWTEERFVECSRDARLLFIGIKNFCDDGGVHPLSLKTIRLEVFGGDEDITSATIQRLVGELVANNLVGVFVAEGAEYLAVFDWEKEQRPEKKNIKYPKPPKDRRQFVTHSLTGRRPVAGLFADQSATSGRPFDPGVGDGTGSGDGSGDGDGSELASRLAEDSPIDRRPVADTEPLPEPQAAKAGTSAEAIKLGQEVLGIIGYPAEAVAHFGQVQAWLSIGYTPEEIRAAAHAISARIPSGMSSPLAWMAKALPDEVAVIRRANGADVGEPLGPSEPPADCTGWRLAAWRALGSVAYASWLAPAQIIVANGVAEIRCKTPFIRDWIQNHYGDRLHRFIAAEDASVHKLVCTHEGEIPYFLRRAG